MGTLLSGRHRDEWMTITRRWTLVAWTSLTAGLLLGARWSYDVLGWGGYWAWDPVENAALMPWLVATAFIHSSMVQERRRLLRIWNLGLVIVAFLLTIFGTFLTRSGILASVHSFTQSWIGPLFVTFLGLATAASLRALLARLPQIRDEGTFDSPFSREAMMLLNNVVLLTMAFTIFFGTIFPLIVEAVTGAKVTVGPPFFNRVLVPLGVVLLIVMGTGTALRWGRSGAEEIRKLGWLGGMTLLVVAARVAVFAGDGTASAGSPDSTGAIELLRPAENFYGQARTPVATPAVHSTWREDLYVVLMAFDPGAQSAVLRAVITPLVSWIWVGGTIMVIAGVLAAWPSRHQ